LSRLRVALLAVAGLLALAILALALALPRLAASDAVRARLTAAVEDATRRSFHFEALEAGLFPPRLEVRGAALSGADGEPAAAARSVQLRLGLLPLLARVVLVRSLVVDGADVLLERTGDGLRLVGRDLPAPERPAGPAPAAKQAPSGDGGFSLAVQRLRLTDSALRVDDRTRTPATSFELRGVEGGVRASAPDAPVEVELRARVAGGGTLALRGEGRLRGPFEGDLELGQLELAPFAPYAEGATLDARADGKIHARGEGGRPEGVELDLRFDATRLAVGGLSAEGPLALHAELAGPDLREATGPIRLDATGAVLAFGDALRKPAGTDAVLLGRLLRTRGAGGVAAALERAELALGAIRATGRIQLQPGLRATLDAPAFEFGALEALLPGLAGSGLTGKLALAGMDVGFDPLSVRGRVVLDGLVLGRVGKQEHPVLRGTLEGLGDEVVGRELRASLAGQEAPITLRVADLAGAPRFRLGARLERADSSALLGALAGNREILSGPLDLTADLGGPLAGPAPLLQAIAGTVDLRIAPGRLRNVSLLRTAFRTARVAESARGKDGSQLDRYYSDEFESLAGRFRVADGKARTDDLRLVYGGYSADLRGGIGLEDRALDLRGSLTLEPEVDSALVGGSGRRRTIPLASVKGTVEDPQVALTPEAMAAIASVYVQDERRREKWEKKLDERLGEGRGKDVLNALDKVLQSLQQPPAEDGGAEKK
jgi:AsmA-like C-terminal region/Domain of Unknown Function (DUF748)